MQVPAVASTRSLPGSRDLNQGYPPRGIAARVLTLPQTAVASPSARSLSSPTAAVTNGRQVSSARVVRPPASVAVASVGTASVLPVTSSPTAAANARQVSSARVVRPPASVANLVANSAGGLPGARVRQGSPPPEVAGPGRATPVVALTASAIAEANGRQGGAPRVVRSPSSPPVPSIGVRSAVALAAPSTNPVANGSPPGTARVLQAPALPTTAVANGRQASGETEFVISVGRSAEMRWGLLCDTMQLNANKVIIDSIQEPSVFSQWNSRSESKGGRQLLVGDQLMEVNGKVNAQEMLQVCQHATSLRIRVRPLLSTQALEAWLDAAKNFQLNADFDISDKLQDGKPLSLMSLMNIMKLESAEKNTIQAIGDKIILSRLLDNMKVPQMPLLFDARIKATLPKVQEFIASMMKAEEAGDQEAFDIVVKPTHLSNGAGALIFSKDKWDEKLYNAEKLLQHMETFLAEKPDALESEALKSLIPGFIVQPCYKSCLEFKAPLEMRVITLWGKARLGIWWWGRQDVRVTPAKGEKPQRTAWLVRKSEAEGLGSSEDSWEVLHEHKGGNKGFEKALTLFLQAMPAMAEAAESIAKAIGAPFLRSDFFVGSEKYGLRLNEVAYGSGVDCRRKSEDGDAADDAPLIARILQEGFKYCKRSEPKVFMELLGAEGATYNSMVITKLQTETLKEEGRPRLPTTCLFGFEAGLMVSPSGAEDCETNTNLSLSSSTNHQARRKNSGSHVEPPPGQVHRNVVRVQGQSRRAVPGVPLRPQTVIMQPNGLSMGVPGAPRMISMPGSVRLNGVGMQAPGGFLGMAPSMAPYRPLASISEGTRGLHFKPSRRAH